MSQSTLLGDILITVVNFLINMFVYELFTTVLNGKARYSTQKSIMFVVVHIAITILPIFKFPSINTLFTYVNVENPLSNSETIIINMFITFVNV